VTFNHHAKLNFGKRNFSKGEIAHAPLPSHMF
jgi:hypothetical protein